ncbi:MAG: tetraacyldisaccharide 4'-kinase [Bdellovibrionales bacterium]|nr:tetraacyldisaccharide 4'-kinase [Bdellovibrionales bacterium]
MRRVWKALSVPYRAATSFRNCLYDNHILACEGVRIPVYCVGNIAAGGSGKTPLVQHIVRMLSQMGENPTVLLRGYGGKEIGPAQVSDSSSSSAVGDEALLHAVNLSVPVVVARDRVAGARYIEEQKLGSCVVLDDGFQHRRLKRDLNVITIDTRSELIRNNFLHDELLPFGFLREPLQEALARTDFLVFNHRGPRLPDGVLQPFMKTFPAHIPAAEMWYESGEVRRGERVLTAPHDVVAVSGIARPQGFRDLLDSLGFKVVFHQQFPDHSQFDSKILARLRKEYSDLPFVCSEKDFVRMEQREHTLWWRLVPNATVTHENELRALIRSAHRRDG